MKKAIQSTSTGKRITYQFTVSFADGTEKVFDIKDDGWKLWISNDGGHVDSLLFEDSRQPNKGESERYLDAWAWERYGEGRTFKTAEDGHTVCVGCGGHTEESELRSHDDDDSSAHDCYCCKRCGKPYGH